MDIDRRTLLGAAALPSPPRRSAAAAAPTTGSAIAREYDVTREVIQLEHGNWGMMARPVLAAYRAHVERVNRDTSYYARRTMVGDLEAARAALASAMGVGLDEIAFTRNATEAMKALILQYNRLKPGDAVLYADLDYDSMQTSMESLAARRGVRVIKIALPEPATRQSLIDAYRAAFDANPAIKMVLLTHLSHRTGLVLPDRRDRDAARERAASMRSSTRRTASGSSTFACPTSRRTSSASTCTSGSARRSASARSTSAASGSARSIPIPAEKPTSTDILTRVHTGTPDYAAQLTVPAALRSRRRSAALAAQRGCGPCATAGSAR